MVLQEERQIAVLATERNRFCCLGAQNELIGFDLSRRTSVKSGIRTTIRRPQKKHIRVNTKTCTFIMVHRVGEKVEPARSRCCRTLWHCSENANFHFKKNQAQKVETSISCCCFLTCFFSSTVTEILQILSPWLTFDPFSINKVAMVPA